MDKLHFSISINASVKKVWNTMLDDETYRKWTEVFMPGSHYEGSWEKGSKIFFLAPGETGKMEGMVSRIRENKPYEFISIEHLGFVQGGEEQTSGPEIENWAGALENYTFEGRNGSTRVSVDMDTVEEYKDMFTEMWPKALQILKDLAEQQK